MGANPVIEIPGYTVLRLLGHGGMATVYLALQQSLRREVALKILSPALAQDAIATERFLREARVSAKLHHPHIVAIHDVGLHDGVPYMSIAYEPGGTVARKTQARDDPKIALRVIRDIASALDYAHSQGVIHRDVKPENILLRNDGTCVLSDFGIAHAVESQTGLTREGTSVGTPHYMSPEQLRGEHVDGRTDLYSLGVVFYQLLTGELPYQGTDGWAIGMQHISAPIPHLPPHVAHLQTFLDALLAKDPSRRLQTGAEVVQWVDARLSGQTAAMTVAMPTPAPLHSPGSTGTRASAASIAILPFADMSQGKDQEYLADGLSEELLNLLSKVPGLVVASRSSAASFKGKSAKLADIGRELKVATVLEGSVRKFGERVRISVQLINADDGFQRWSETYDRQLTDVFAVQDEIAALVVAELTLQLLPKVVPPVNPEIANQLKIGNERLAGASRKGALAAIAAFDKVLALDPAHAQAQAGRAQAQTDLTRLEAADAELKAAKKAQARDAAERAAAEAREREAAEREAAAAATAAEQAAELRRRETAEREAAEARQRETADREAAEAQRREAAEQAAADARQREAADKAAAEARLQQLADQAAAETGSAPGNEPATLLRVPVVTATTRDPASEFASAYMAKAVPKAAPTSNPPPPDSRPVPARKLLTPLRAGIAAVFVLALLATWLIVAHFAQQRQAQCEASLAQAQSAADAGEFDQAAAIVQQAGESCTGDGLARLQALGALAQEGKSKTELCELAEKQARALLDKGLPALAGEALAPATNACVARPSFAVLEQRQQSAESEARTFVDRASSLLTAGALDEAQALIEEALKRDASSADALKLREKLATRRARMPATGPPKPPEAAAATAIDQAAAQAARQLLETQRRAEQQAKLAAAQAARRREPAKPVPAPAAPPAPAAVTPTPAPALGPTPTPASAPAAASRPTQSRRALVPVRTPQPAYPPQALRSHIAGEVTVTFTVNTDGSVSNVRVVAAEPHGIFDRTVISAVGRRKFEPVEEAQTATRSIHFKP